MSAPSELYQPPSRRVRPVQECRSRRGAWESNPVRSCSRRDRSIEHSPLCPHGMYDPVHVEDLAANGIGIFGSEEHGRLCDLIGRQYFAAEGHGGARDLG
jgi:hypothetical protein